MRRVMSLILMVAMSLSGTALAAEFSWTGAGADTDWSNGDNWNPTEDYPGWRDIADLYSDASDNAPQTINLDVSAGPDAIRYGNGIGDGDLRNYTINSSNGSVFNVYGTAEFISPQGTPSADLTINAGMNISTSSTSYARIGTRPGVNVTINGAIQQVGGGTAGIIAQGGGKLYLGGNNTLTKTSYLKEGTEVIATGSNALGTSAVTFTVGGGILSLESDLTLGSLNADIAVPQTIRSYGDGHKTLTVLGDTYSYGVNVLLDPKDTSTLTVRIEGGNNGDWETTENSTIEFAGTSIRYGSVNGSGRLVINSASEFLLNGTYTHTGGTSIENGIVSFATSNMLPVGGDLSIDQGSNVSMNLRQSVGNLTVGGILIDSTDVAGDAVFNSTAKLIMELSGYDPLNNIFSLTGTQSDLSLAGILEITDEDMDLLPGDYVLFDLNGGSINGVFDNIIMPEGFAGTVTIDSGDLVLSVVPEPSTLCLIGFGVMFFRRKK